MAYLFKIDSKDNARKFFVMLFDMPDTYATIYMKMSF